MTNDRIPTLTRGPHPVLTEDAGEFGARRHGCDKVQ